MAPSPKLRIVVVDDSLNMRSLLDRAFSEVDDMEVIGTASNSEKAIAAVGNLEPDIVVINAEMPVMDGVTALNKMREKRPGLPAIVFTSPREGSASVGLRVLGMAHTKWLTRPTASEALGGAGETWEEMLFAVRYLTVRASSPSSSQSEPAAALPTENDRRQHRGPYSVLVIGASTGGTDALTEVLSELPASLPVPVVIVQHMPSGFTQQFAERLNSNSELRVRQGTNGEVISAGNAYLAPGGYHMVIEREANELKLSLNKEPKEHCCRPAVDPMFRSAVEACGSSVLAVVLTGMGFDGAAGCGVVRSAGGRVLIQDEATSVVWGMPGEVYRTGQADEVHPLGDVALAITSTLFLAQAKGKQSRKKESNQS
ncbi:MAG: chemotaxis-specific protein-glutamate methyltransferase CheB [Planctomycetota bacterium]|jgi:two-component system chemotaxis response regulator CheB